jgi:hypothetical protein
LEEVDIGDGITKRPMYVGVGSSDERKAVMCGMLKEFAECFAWSYTEMPGLSRELVEHHLPIKLGFRPYKQPARSFKPEIVSKVMEEVDRLLQAGFIRPCRYVELVSNIVPVEKKNTRKIKICIDFHNLNRATPKDEYPMLIADVLINNASSNKMISFMDGNAGYNHIFMAEGDVCKIAFCCPRFVGLFEWIVMSFVLKNAGATYQMAMNLIFHHLLWMLVEIYINDIVVKSARFSGHTADLKVTFKRMKKYGLRMNPLKCAFGVSAGKFLGFVVNEQGIQIDSKMTEFINKLVEPTCKKEVQKLLGKINYLRHFIINLAGKVDSFLPLVRLKHEGDFAWGAEQKEAFE